MRRVVTAFLLVLMLLPVRAGADDVETVTEPSSGLKFSTRTEGGLVLLGVGIRKFLMIKGYATAMYVDAEGFKKAVTDRSIEGMGRAIQFGEFPRRLLLQFVRNVGAERVKDVFRAALKKSMTQEDFKAEEEEIEKFLSGCWDLKEGDIFTLYSAGVKTTILHGDRLVYEGTSVRLGRGMWGGYFGKDPVSLTIRESMLARASLILDGKD